MALHLLWKPPASRPLLPAPSHGPPQPLPYRCAQVTLPPGPQPPSSRAQPGRSVFSAVTNGHPRRQDLAAAASSTPTTVCLPPLLEQPVQRPSQSAPQCRPLPHMKHTAPTIWCAPASGQPMHCSPGQQKVRGCRQPAAAQLHQPSSAPGVYCQAPSCSVNRRAALVSKCCLVYGCVASENRSHVA